MKCPACVNNDLVMSERSQVEIDYCPNCRGIWLDRGELDKILDKVTANEPPRRDTRPPDLRTSDPRYNDPRYNDPRYHKPGKHWLRELFD
ncbi:MAG TPA: zf-TFIIB domain-containing protein [Bacteroidales bacterium]|nr:zf-TFIIB domain-containing protein [Bacteroidales bacterium]